MVRSTMKNYSFWFRSSACARSVSRLVAFGAIVLTTKFVHAHGADEDRSDYGTGRVVIKTQGDKRIIESNGIPDHKPGQFPNRGNPNSISAQKYHFEMPLKPR